VGLALASSACASAYACSSSSSSNPDSGGDGGTTPIDAGDSGDSGDASAAFADESTFSCALPLAPVLDGLTPTAPVDYLELRQRKTVALDADAATPDPVTAVATHGTACATAADKSACATALAGLVPGDAGAYTDGWYTDGDNDGPHLVGSYAKEIVVFTRGDTVGALRNTADVAAFLGTIDSLAEARLLLATKNQPLVCTTDPAKSGWRRNEDGSYDLLIAGYSCGTFIKYRIRYHVAKDGTVTTVARDPSLTNGICGRRPEGLVDALVAGGAREGLAAHFVEAAYLEAASVVAFRRLELELRRFGAPPSLVQRARRARAEEIDHARETSRLARQHGGVVPPLSMPDMMRRELVAVAIENAVEGCVRETFGALVATFQAERAVPELRPLLRRIARDEARHAELAHDVARWIDRKLTPAERAEVAAARVDALATLAQSVAREPAADVVRVAGMPTSREARVLLDGLARFVSAAPAVAA
jgi:hypothetical protein